jgi:hypothetical protein
MPPWPLRWLVSQGLLMAAAHLFFFPPIEVHTDTAQRVCDAISRNVGAVAAAVAGVRAAAA